MGLHLTTYFMQHVFFFSLRNIENLGSHLTTYFMQHVCFFNLRNIEILGSHLTTYFMQYVCFFNLRNIEILGSHLTTYFMQEDTVSMGSGESCFERVQRLRGTVTPPYDPRRGRVGADEGEAKETEECMREI